jgi:aromatic ring-opening dioxygenase catalytic subunit (LigB family)
MLRSQGFNAKPNTTFDWIHDTYLVLIRMFPNGCPPTTIISMNARYDPHFHIKIGAALRPLRALSEKTLFIGSGGAVHNLYRNKWAPMLLYRDNFAMPTPPEAWALDFRQEVEDAFTKVPPGKEMRKAVAGLMKLQGYREAHGSDDHFMAALFVAGLCTETDGRGVLGAEDWELTNMANSQFTLGQWPRRLDG